MSRLIPLNKTVQYSKKRINSENVSLENFISTDNVLQNKSGVTIARNLPPNGLAMPAYSEGDILLANIRPYLKKIWFADKNGGCSSDVLVFETKKGYFPKFIYYNLFKDDFFEYVMKGSKGTKMPRGDKNQILNFLIPDFDISNQKKIAKVLSDLDAKIELNNKVNSELESMAKTLYDYWFVQFDFPDADGKPYKTSGGKVVWNEELKREIPEGWEDKSLEDVLEIKYGKDHKKLSDGKIPVFGSGGIMRFADKAIYEDESILIPRKGSLKNLFYINTPFWSVDTMFYTKMKNDNSAKYLFFHLQYLKLSSLNVGTAVPSLTTEVLNKVKVLFPPQKILGQFDNFVKPLFEKKEKNLKENQQLASLRDWLLPMLMNGQVRVGDVEEELGMVAEPKVEYKNN